MDHFDATTLLLLSNDDLSPRIFSFVGTGSFLNMALVSKRFKAVYLSYTNHSRVTTEKAILQSVWLLKAAIEEGIFLQPNEEPQFGQVQPHGDEEDTPLLCTRIAQHGNLAVLEYARRLDYPWSSSTSRALIERQDFPMMRYARNQNIPYPFTVFDPVCNSCCDAASEGRIDLLFWLRSATPPYPWDEWTFPCAAKEGRITVLEWLSANGCPVDSVEAYVQAISSGQWHVVRWLRRLCPWDASLCRRLAREGLLNGLRFVRAQQPPCPWDASVCTGAVWSDRLNVLEWLRSQNPPCPWDFKTCQTAMGKSEIFQFLMSQDPPCPCGDSDNGRILCIVAAGEKQLDILQVLRSRNPPCPWDVYTCNAAAKIGWLEGLKWLRSETPPCPWEAGTCEAAAGKGQLKAVIWLRSQTPPCPWGELTCEAAARSGHWDVVQWLLDNGCPHSEGMREQCDRWWAGFWDEMGYS